MTATNIPVRVEPIMYGAQIYCSDDCHPDAVVYLGERGPDVVKQRQGEMPWEVWDAVVSVVSDYRAKMGE